MDSKELMAGKLVAHMLENDIRALRTENAALKEQVAQWETEYNGCSTLLNNAERTIETLEETIAQQAEAIRLKDAALEKIACIGNGDSHGNSIGNCLAIDALAIQPSTEILQARDEPVAYLDANYGFMRCGNAADHLPIGTKLYAVPPQPAPSVPEGYQLVPIEPTEAMQEAWDGESSLMGTWNAMLAAARGE